MTRNHICDVPGCSNTRHRWQRLCSQCFAALPHPIRVGIKNTFKAHASAEHRQYCKSARAFLDERDRAREAASQRAYHNTARLLGEHDDDTPERNAASSSASDRPERKVA